MISSSCNVAPGSMSKMRSYDSCRWKCSGSVHVSTHSFTNAPSTALVLPGSTASENTPVMRFDVLSASIAFDQSRSFSFPSPNRILTMPPLMLPDIPIEIIGSV